MKVSRRLSQTKLEWIWRVLLWMLLFLGVLGHLKTARAAQQIELSIPYEQVFHNHSDDDTVDDTFQYQLTASSPATAPLPIGSDAAAARYLFTVKGTTKGALALTFPMEAAGAYVYDITAYVPEAVAGYTYEKREYVLKLEVREADGGLALQAAVIECPDMDKKVTEIPLDPEYTASERKASVRVRKQLQLEDGTALTAVDDTYYAALFSDEAGTERVTEVQALHFSESSEAETVFEDLKPGTVYYLFEVDEDGEIEDIGVVEDTIFVPEYEEDGRVETGASGEIGASFVNMFVDIPPYGYYVEGSITVKKLVVDENDKPLDSDETFYLGIFLDEDLTELATTDEVGSPVIKLPMGGKSEVTVEVPVYLTTEDELDFYLAEVKNEKGDPINKKTWPYEAVFDKKSSGTLKMGKQDASFVLTNRKKTEAGQTTSPSPKPTSPEEEEDIPDETEVEVPTAVPTAQAQRTSQVVSGSTGRSAVVSSAQPTVVPTAVQTGDDTPILSTILLLLGSLVALVGIICAVRRRRQRR